MAAKTFYLKDATASSSSHGSLQDGGTPPATAATTTGFSALVSFSNGTTFWAESVRNSSVGSGAFGTTTKPGGVPGDGGAQSPASDCWRSENALSGVFDAGTWTFSIGVFSPSGIIGNQTTISFRFWHSTDPTGTTGATEITGGSTDLAPAITSLVASGSATLSLSGPLGALSLSNEYLFIQVAFKIVGLGQTEGDLLIVTDSVASKLTTTNFTAFDAAIMPLVKTVYPDVDYAILRRRKLLDVQHQLAVQARYPQPEITNIGTKGWRPRHDDILRAIQLRRTDLEPQQQQDVPHLYAVPEVTKTDTKGWRGRHDDIVPSVGRWRWLESHRQQDVPKLYPRPELTNDGTKAWRPRYGDQLAVTVRRMRDFHVSRQQFYTKIPPAPERTLPAYDPEFPDLIVRPKLTAEDQQDVTDVPPLPERTNDGTKAWRGVAPEIVPVRRVNIAHLVEGIVFPVQTTAAVVVPTQFQPAYPDRAPGPPSLHTSRHLFVTKEYPQPERTYPASDPEYPDGVPRAWYRLGDQLDVCEMPTQPERTNQIADTEFADRVPSAATLHPRHLPVTAVSPAPERAAPLADVVAPVRVDRAWLRAEHQRDVTKRPAAPEQALPLDHQPSYPDRNVRPAVAPAHQPWWATSPAPERTQALADVAAPVRVERPAYAAPQQQPVTVVSPAPERTQAIADLVVPHRVERPTYAAPRQPYATAVPPQPEQTIPLDHQPTYPDRPVRPAVPAPHQPYYAANVAPDRTTPIAWAEYVPRAPAPLAHHPRHQDAAAMPIAPEQRLPLDHQPHYPDAPRRPVVPAAHQPYWVTSPKPEVTVPLAWQPTYPDRAAHAWIAAAAQPTWATSPQPEQTVVLDHQPVYPERVPRPTVPAAVQPYYASITKPEERIQLAWQPVAPERVVRPAVPTAVQPTWAMAPQPELTAPLAWAPEYPARPTRAAVHASAQPYWTTSPAPERTAPLADVIFPARVDRPALHAAQQQDVPHVWPVPEITSQATYGWRGSAPDGVAALTRWRWLAAAAQQDVPHLHPAPDTTNDATKGWRPRYEDAVVVRGRWLAVAHQQDVPHLYAVPEVTADATKGWRPRYDDITPRVGRWLTQPAYLADGMGRAQFAPLAPPAPVEGYPLYPDRAPAPLTQHPRHMDAAVSTVAPERRAPLADVSAPERVARPTYGAAWQQASTTVPARPEQRLPLDHQPVYPERIVRPVLLAAAHPTWAMAPAPERTATLVVVEAPVAVARPAYAAAAQQASLPLPPAPEVKAPRDWSTDAPERPVRAAYPHAAQPAFTTSPQPERRAPMAVVEAPVAILRPAYRAAHQQASLPLGPQPVATIFMDWLGTAPVAAPRPAYPPAAQPTWAMAPQPERASDAAAHYPPAVSRPALAAAAMWAVPPIPPHPERAIGMDPTAHAPAAVTRPTMPAHLQLAYAPPPPDAPPLHAAWGPEYADRAVRPWLPTAAHQHTAASLQPERAVYYDAAYPDRVERPTPRAVDQPYAAALWPLPLPSDQLLRPQPIYPAHVVRHHMLAAWQLHVTTFYPEPQGLVVAPPGTHAVLDESGPVGTLDAHPLPHAQLSGRGAYTVDMVERRYSVRLTRRRDS